MNSIPFVRLSSALTIICALALSACGGGTSGMPPAPTGATQQAPQSPANSGAPSTTGTSSAVQTVTVTSGDHVLPKSAMKGNMYLTYSGYKNAAAASNRRTPQSITYPSDLQYFGGPFLKTAKVYNAFVNSNSSTFATPNLFEEHFSYSNMIHILDQYVAVTSSNRYDWAGDLRVNFPSLTGTLGDDQLLEIVHAVAAAVAPNAGRKNIYNIFFPNGLNYCSTGTILPVGACNNSHNSPNPAFCGFHTSVTFSDVGEVLFTFQPYQDVTDPITCAANANEPTVKTPNGVFADSTYSTLSHELSETITDPEPGNLAWYAFTPLLANGEIGDLCAYQGQTVTLSGKAYYIQREWSNKVHGCDNLQP